MSDQELAEVHRDASVHEVEEDQVVGAVLLDADRELVGEAANRSAAGPIRRRCAGSPPAEGSCRASGRRTATCHRPGLNHQQRRSPSTASRIITRSTMRPIVREPPVPVVGLANRFVERLVVDVVQPSSPDRSRLDGSGESAGYETGHELTTVLAAHGAGERAVLPLQKAAGVDHHGHEELTLPLREAEVAQGVDTRLR